jgi:hypothetical protein
MWEEKALEINPSPSAKSSFIPECITFYLYMKVLIVFVFVLYYNLLTETISTIGGIKQYGKVCTSAQIRA